MRLSDSILSGDRRALSRAITFVENGDPEARALLEELYPRVGRARRIGFTGPPGVGKSTLVCELARFWRTQGKTVGIVAVDPSSPFTGGALLGDRIRMASIGTDPGVFIRSMATRGALGGLARATYEVCDVLDAAGKDVVLVETVGVGQSEIEIVRVADTTVVILSPESGDGVQAMKSGLMEIADVLVINKADRPGADALESQIRATFELSSSRKPPAIFQTAAATGKGISEAAAGIETHTATMERDGTLRAHRAERLRFRITRLVEEALARRLAHDPATAAWLDRRVEDVLAGRVTPADAAEEALDRLTSGPDRGVPRRPARLAK
ncbi:MAG: methylmalonyl Co-A mutase-associated GTPase MeaB [Planctomycetes bacterium]|nr:methylmalonyl Co-A mutase-associated GTPase MeaB [Planctomycetota bacterium]